MDFYIGFANYFRSYKIGNDPTVHCPFLIIRINLFYKLYLLHRCGMLAVKEALVIHPLVIVYFAHIP